MPERITIQVHFQPALQFSAASQKSLPEEPPEEILSDSCRMWLALLFAGAVLAFTTTRGRGHEVVVCPPNNQLFISDNRSLLPLENIQASNESPLYPTANILNANAGWCTNPPSFIGEYVNFTFTQPVVLTVILSSSFFTNQYVNNFSIAYSPSEGGNGSFFDIYGVTSTPQDFFVPSNIGPFRLFALEQPIVATKLQLVINGGVSATGSNTCWIVGMLGCTLSEAETIGLTESDTNTTPPSVTRQHTSSQTTLANPTTSLAPMVSPTCQLQAGSATSGRGGATREEVLAIALPIAVGTVVIVTLIVVVGVMICNFKNWRKDKWSPSMQYSTLAKASEPGAVTTSGGRSEGRREREETLRAVDNVLYEGSMSVDLGSHQLRNRVATLREVENVLYGDNAERSEEQNYESVAGSVLGHLEESVEVIQNVTAGPSLTEPGTRGPAGNGTRGPSLTEPGTRGPAGNEYESVKLATTE